ncbi:hypothetical protein [Streptomyces sp. x-19]|uniref:hypothetical protein n=1 Tax=Streptomyces sp. x-19 TaxID=2789280 RepID=UPI0039815A7B
MPTLRSLGRRRRSISKSGCFFCDNSDCAKKTFAEQVEQLTFRYGRRTVTLQRLLQQVALALGGQAGERLAERLAVPVIGPTLLRLIRTMDVPEVPELSVLGVDEFAFRGHVYPLILASAPPFRAGVKAISELL